MTDWNRDPYVDDEGKLHYGPYWDTGGGMIILREALNPDDPNNLYNYLKSAGIKPEDYGVRCPVEQDALDTYGHLSREELISLCMQQRRDIEAMYRAGY